MDIENDNTNRHMGRSNRKGFIMFVVNKSFRLIIDLNLVMVTYEMLEKHPSL